MMLALLLAIQSVPSSTPAPAPPAPSPPAQPAPVACRVADVRSVEAKQAAPQGPFDLYVVCDDKAVWLGTADRFASSYSMTLRSMVVVARSGARSRVAFVSPGGDGTLHLDDVSRELTKLTGRYADAGLGGVEVDLRRFAVDGSIAVPVAAHDGQPATSAALDLTSYAAFTAALRPIPATPTPPEATPTPTGPNGGR